MDIQHIKKFIIKMFIKYINREPNFNELYIYLKEFELAIDNEKQNFENKCKNCDEYLQNKHIQSCNVSVNDIANLIYSPKVQYYVINNIITSHENDNLSHFIQNENIYHTLSNKYFNQILSSFDIAYINKLDPIKIFLYLLHKQKIIHISDIKYNVYLNNCYIIALTPNDMKINNIQTVFNKDQGMYIFIFNNDIIYFYDNFILDNVNLYHLFKNSDIKISDTIFNDNYFLCLNNAIDLKDSICNILGILHNHNYIFQNNLIPLAGFSHSYVNDIIKIFHNDICFIENTNTIYKINKLIIYKNTQSILPFRVNKHILQIKIYNQIFVKNNKDSK